MNKTWSKILFWLILVVMPVTAYLRMQPRWDLEKPGFNRDLLAHQQELREMVPEKSLVIAGADASPHVWLYYLHHEGWAYPEWGLTPEWVAKKRAAGAQYLYTDLPEEKITLGVREQMGELMLTAGSIRVFRLQPGPENEAGQQDE